MSSGRILVVDDDPQIRRIMRMTLIAEGFEVSDARSGEDALDKLTGDKFDLIILDMNMPGCGGLETCRRVRSISDVAIIMLTVRSGETDKVAALDAGADDYVTKPFGMPELMARLRAVLRRFPLSAEGGPQVITLDDVEVNFATRRVIAGDHEIRLTPKEFDLLQYLVSHPDIPIPHARLLQAVWGPDYSSEVAYLRTFINQLRKKIEKDPSNPKYILTEPWVGYRFHLPDAMKS